MTDCTFSPDGTVVVSASDDQTLKLWDCETGNVLATLIGHALPVNARAFSPDGKLIVSTSNESTRIWDAAARSGHIDAPGRIQTCAFSADGTKAVLDESVVFDIASGKRLDSADHETVTSFDLNASFYGEVWEWDPVPTQIRFSTDSDYIISVIDQKLKVSNADASKEVRVIYDKAPATFCVSPDGRKVVCSILEDAFDQSIKCFETLTGVEKFTIMLARPYGGRTQMRFTFDSRIAVVLTDAGTLILIDAESGEIVSEFLHHEKVTTFDTSPTENVVIAGGELGSVYILRLENFN